MLRGTLRAEGTAPISLFAFQDIIFAATGIFLLIAIMMTLFGKIDLISSEALEETEVLRRELTELTETQITAKRKIDVLQELGPKRQSQELQVDSALPASVVENIWLYDIQQLFAANATLRKQADTAYQKLSRNIMNMNRKEHRLELLQSGAYQTLEGLDIAIIREGSEHDFREPVFLTLDSKGYTISYPGSSALDHEFENLSELRASIEHIFSPETQSFLIHVKPSGIKHFEPAKETLRKLGFSLGYEPVLEDFKIK